MFGGIADKKVATEKLKGLNYMAAFPTTFIIDRRGEVRRSTPGFTGTVTGQYYDDYVKKFNGLLDQLIAEPNPYEPEAHVSAGRAGGAGGLGPLSATKAILPTSGIRGRHRGRAAEVTVRRGPFPLSSPPRAGAIARAARALFGDDALPPDSPHPHVAHRAGDRGRSGRCWARIIGTVRAERPLPAGRRRTYGTIPIEARGPLEVHLLSPQPYGRRASGHHQQSTLDAIRHDGRDRHLTRGGRSATSVSLY